MHATKAVAGSSSSTTTLFFSRAIHNHHHHLLLPHTASRLLHTCRTTPYCSGSNSNNRNGSSDADGEDDDDTSPAHTQLHQQKPLRVERLLANLGYRARKECAAMIKRGQLVLSATGQRLKVGDKALASELLLNGEPLDPPPPLTLLLHKPVGYVVTSPDDEKVQDPKVYDLLPYR